MATLKGGIAIRVFLSFASAYLISYALRTINAIIAPSLKADVGLTDADLGLLSSAYFLAFACLQLPLGIWLDKYGARKIEAGLLLLAAVGAAIFAISDSLLGLWIGRALIGLGVSACLMAPFKAFRQWYQPHQQGQLASLMLVAGTSGAMLSTVPASALLPLIGWRGVFWVMSVVVLLSAAAVFFVLRKAEAVQAASEPARPQAAAASGGYRAVFTHPYFRRMGVLGLISAGTFNAMYTLWAGPWMITVLGMSNEETARVLFLLNLCLMLAYLGMSWLAPRLIAREGKGGLTVHRAIAIGLGGTILLEAVMVGTAAPWTWICWPVLACCMTVMVLMQVSVGLSFPVSVVGRANTAYNLLVFMGAFIMQWGIGLMSDAFQSLGLSPVGGLRAAFAVGMLIQAAALASFLVNKAQPDKH